MESYEEFCSSSLARLQTEGKRKMCCEASSPQGALSLIRFHGRAVLLPVMSEEQRWEMAQYRQRAAQLDAERQSLHRTSLLTRVQAILDSVQVCKLPEGEERPPTPPTRCSPKPEYSNGFALLPNMAGPTWGERGSVGDATETVPPERETPVFLDGMRGEGLEEWGDGGEEGAVSLQSLLKKSREYLEREQGWGSQGSCVATPTATPRNALRESLSDKENESGGGQPCHGPNQSPPSPDHGHPGSDPNGSPDPLPCSLTGPYAQVPNPEPSQSPRPHRRRPRPISAGNIYISFPVCMAEQERGALAGWGPSEKRSPDNPSPTDSLSPTGAGARRGSHSGAEVGLVSACVLAPTGQDSVAPGFRRRSQTLDSQLYPCHSGPPVDRSQERVPRFMGGIPWRTPCRRSPPVPLNQSYDVESPAPALLRPQVARSPTPGHMKRSLDMEGQLTLDLQTTPLEQQDNKTREAQWEVQALEAMQRQLEEDHALQLSLLIAEQEREHQRLQQELEERERRLRDQGGKRATAGDLGADWQGQRDSCPTLSPASATLKLAGHTLSPAERSPGPIRSMGFPSSLSPSSPSPALQPPVYLWGPSWGSSKMRGRLSQRSRNVCGKELLSVFVRVLTPELHAALCRLGAVARGFLTRRLLMTEKVKHLRQTVQDMQEFIGSFQTEGPLRRSSVSAQDLSLQERVRAQLRAALFDVHDIFFEMPVEERLTLLQQERELRLERKLREMEKAKSPRDRVSLSAATQKSLDRKKQRVVGSPGQAKRMQHKPKSPPTNRVLQPSQGQNAPVPGQLLRQGSLYRKGPEERVKHSDSLRKQHSLG
ncbi:hypothetical protein AAFF_G00419410 [Aldrovandia affinis]|uniref:Centriolar coiled-coil protein of 110 kDa-like n=1 Tax=Aldrovandia affinis TaxID=143900 RepID=A0AAD7WJW9_9TELE|nr:hypothetical protein AAFF_G00419410 [Aldrovandia affinis]